MNSSDSTVVTPVPITTSEQIIAKITDLQECLQKQLPGYESLLHTIHRQLANDQDTVHLLTEEQIGVICAGLSKRTGVYIAKAEAEKKSKGRGKVGLEDL